LWIAKRCSPARVRWRRAAKRRALARSAPFCSPDVGATGGSGGNEDRTEALENKVYTKLLTLPKPLDERWLQVCYGPISLGWLDGYRHRFSRLKPRQLQNLKPSL
jgi:hypothetical protein